MKGENGFTLLIAAPQQSLDHPVIVGSCFPGTATAGLVLLDRRSLAFRRLARTVYPTADPGYGKLAGAAAVVATCFAHPRIADGVAPIDQSLLGHIRKFFQPGRGLGKHRRLRQRARQRTADAIGGDVRANAPVGALANAGLERIDHLTRAQAAHLVVDDLVDANRVARPIGVRRLLGGHLAAAVADQNRLVSLPRRLEAEVVVDAAVAQHRTRRCTADDADPRSRMPTHDAGSKSIVHGDNTGGKADDAATATASSTVGLSTRPTR